MCAPWPGDVPLHRDGGRIRREPTRDDRVKAVALGDLGVRGSLYDECGRTDEPQHRVAAQPGDFQHVSIRARRARAHSPGLTARRAAPTMPQLRALPGTGHRLQCATQWCKGPRGRPAPRDVEGPAISGARWCFLRSQHAQVNTMATRVRRLVTSNGERRAGHLARWIVGHRDHTCSSTRDT